MRQQMIAGSSRWLSSRTCRGNIAVVTTGAQLYQRGTSSSSTTSDPAKLSRSSDASSIPSSSGLQLPASSATGVRRSGGPSPIAKDGKLAQIIKDSIKATGPMPVSRYMQFCLSHPTEGYYQKGDVFGRKGDFITSPEISQIFGELLAIWLLTMWMAAGSPARARLVELGPGRGTLMDDILRTFATFPGISAAVKSVHLVENSVKMQQRQEEKLRPRIEDSGIDLLWNDKIDDIPDSEDFTMVIAHEFFDAMPINLFEKREQGYREVLVNIDPVVGALRLSLSPEPTPLSTVLPATSPRFAKLPLGSRIEVAQDSWKIMRKVGELISSGGGAGLVVDYGGDRVFGSSFRAFRNHEIVEVFDEPGSSDLTANVDFAYLKEALHGVATPLGPISQSQFLLSLGLQPRLNKLLVSAPSDQRRAELRNGAKRLVDTLGMGSQYQALGVVPNDEPAGEAYPFS